jgi:hypothetical protein
LGWLFLFKLSIREAIVDSRKSSNAVYSLLSIFKTGESNLIQGDPFAQLA